jgi:hypothetical protein
MGDRAEIDLGNAHVSDLFWGCVFVYVVAVQFVLYCSKQSKLGIFFHKTK